LVEFSQFAQLAVAYIGQFFENFRSSPNFGATFSTVKVMYYLFMNQNALRYIFAGIFTNSSGHPGSVISLF
jgi:hypothetical protein